MNQDVACPPCKNRSLRGSTGRSASDPGCAAAAIPSVWKSSIPEEPRPPAEGSLRGAVLGALIGPALVAVLNGVKEAIPSGERKALSIYRLHLPKGIATRPRRWCANPETG